MKGFPFKRHLILLGVAILLIGIMVPLASFAKSSSGEHGTSHPPRPPQVEMQTDPATGLSDPTATIMQACPANTPINPPGFKAGDVVTITASFTSTDSGESTEPDEVNNALAVFDTAVKFAPVFVKLNQTKTFTFTASAGDQLKACFTIYDGDEVGTVNYTVTPKSAITLESLQIIAKKNGKTVETVLLDILNIAKTTIGYTLCVGLGVVPAIVAFKAHQFTLAISLIASHCTGFIAGVLSQLLKPGIIRDFLRLVSIGLAAFACLTTSETGVGLVIICIPLGIAILQEILHPGGFALSNATSTRQHLIRMNS